MQAPHTATQWTRHWLYDWGGANVDLFLVIQRALPDGWIWLPETLSVGFRAIIFPAVAGHCSRPERF